MPINGIFRVLCCGAALAIGCAARADGPPPFPDFSAKFEKAPAPGAARGPLVQITPRESPVAEDAGDADATAAPRLGWFWEVVPAEIGADRAARLQAAAARLANPPAGAAPAAPRLEALQGILRERGADILRATIGTRVSPALALSVIAVESGGRAEALSDKGAQGLMQLMPDTAARFDVADPLVASENIRGGVAYLDWLIGEFGGDVILALAGYNAGEGALREHGGVPPFAETRAYVPRVLAAFEVARGLCKTRPELVTDACAFDLALN